MKKLWWILGKQESFGMEYDDKWLERMSNLINKNFYTKIVALRKVLLGTYFYQEKQFI